ncbi:MAG: PAS domain S-box protein [Deltaproteobacteria bacterium]|nr:PAS domain S-box protein [Deltaproteobacteria bacterium]
MQHIHTLIVEDSRPDALILQGLMAKSTLFDFDCRLVGNGSDAVDKMASHQFDLVLLDLGLPDSSGNSPLENFSTLLIKTPTIVLAADKDMELAKHALRIGAQDYLVKGQVNLLILEKSVRYALERHASKIASEADELQMKEAVLRSQRMLAALDKANQNLEKEIARGRLLTTAIEQSVETVVITDTDGTILYANKSFEDLTGYTVAETIGQNPRLLKSGLHDDAFYRELWNCLKTTGIWQGRIKNRKKDGTIFEEDARISSVKNTAGVVTNYVAVKKDITHEAALEMQLIQSRKMQTIGQLAAGIAHEINTPAQYVGDNVRFLQEAVDGFVEVLAEYEKLTGELYPELKTDDGVQALNKVKENVDLDFLLEEAPVAIAQSLEGIERISKIVLAMKEFSHPGTEQMTIHDINKALKSTVTVASNEWKYVASVEMELANDLPLIPCFVGEMNQVFLNVIVNAAHTIADKGGEKGNIRIKTLLEEPFVRIDISDTGCGIPEGIRDKIFDPFFTTKEVGKGTGQGLAMAFTTITERHHGQIRVESNVGKGTTVSILLPLKKVEVSSDAE